MTTTYKASLDSLKYIAIAQDLAVSLTFDPSAGASETWIAAVGLDAFGAGPTPETALGAALRDLDGEGVAAAVRWAVPASPVRGTS